ncbi:MAG TPA: DUF4835 family protein [Rubricoccaceae bacterium]|nr:DUF4835 family protein [Rubricoccaceae bacterium]
MPKGPLFVAAALCLLATVFSPPARAQELNCTVAVDYTALQGNEFQFLSELREEIRRYLNDRSWTEDVYQDRERIDCGFNITFRQAEGLSRFQAQLVVTSTRPIYGTPQRTNVFAIQDDDWTFDYNRGQGLIFNPARFDSFVSVLDFYAYLILGYDYDTFSELGGEPYFERARQIAELARGVGALGWEQAGDERTRSALIQQLLDPRYQPLRIALFEYHFGVLDHFATEHEAAWDRAVGVLERLFTLYEELGVRRYATDLFWSAKHQELAALLADAPRRSDAYDLLVEMDPPHQTTYDALITR